MRGRLNRRARWWWGTVLAAAAVVGLSAPFLTLVASLTARALEGLAERPEVWSAAAVSVTSAATALAAAALTGVPLAYLLARRAVPGWRVVEAVVLFPVVLPPVVSGVLLASLWGPAGPLGRVLDRLGWQVTGTWWGVVVAQAFVAAPFVIAAARSAFEAVPTDVEDAARLDGADAATVFLRVALPLGWGGVRTGLWLGWARALGEFGATMVVAYNPHSLPVQVWIDLGRGGLREALPLSAVLWALGLAVLALLRRGQTRSWV